MSLPSVPTCCPKCAGFVLRNAAESRCLNCGWYPRFPVEPEWTERQLDAETAERIERQSAKSLRLTMSREEWNARQLQREREGRARRKMKKAKEAA